MKPLTGFCYSILMFALFTTACGAALTNTPPPAPPQAPTLTPIPSDAAPTAAATGSAPTLSAPTASAPTLSPDQFPPRPTATLNVTGPVAENGLYANAEWGVTVRYPDSWLPRPETDPSQGGLEWFDSPDSTISGILFYTAQGGQGLEAAARSIEQSSFGSLKDLAIVSDQAVTLSSGRPAWRTVITAKFGDGSPLKASMTTILGGSNTFSLMVFGPPASFQDYQSDIDQLTASLDYAGAGLFGVPRGQALVLAGGESSNPRYYDPATTTSGSDGLVFTGLVSLDPQLQLVPDLAESWTITGGVVYTFRLRHNARFHNGRPVTAEDFVYSWERAADPATNSDTVITYLGDVVGMREKHAGQADHIAGLRAIADDSLQVTIDAPKPYFLLKLTYPTAFVLDRANVESGPEWYRTPNGTGPYRLIRWDRQKEIIYERNEDFYLGPPAIPYVITRLYAGDDVRLYESGEVDMAYVGVYQAERFLQPEEPLHTELHSGVNMCTSYVSLDNQQPPFDDVKARKAFAMAFDRQKYLDVLYNGKGIPAIGAFPPGMAGFNPDLQGLAFDPPQARQMLAESKYGGAGRLPPIIFTNRGYGSDIGAGVSALVQMWQVSLGVTIAVENLEPDRYIDEVYAGRHGQIIFSGWCADYPDPENFADVLFHSGSTQNESHYSSRRVDALLEQARVEPDVGKRIWLYQQVEQIIVDDAPVIFVSHAQAYVLVKPYVKGFVFTAIGIPLTRYLSIDASQIK